MRDERLRTRIAIGEPGGFTVAVSMEPGAVLLADEIARIEKPVCGGIGREIVVGRAG